MTTTDSRNTGSLVVGVDGSAHGEHAVTWAAQEALLRNRPLTLVHAEGVLGLHEQAWLSSAGISPREMTDQLQVDAEQMLAHAHDLAAAAAPGIEADTLMRAGDAREVFLDLAPGATMIVLGSRGRGPVSSLLLGSVSIAVSRRATCPVVVIRPYDGDLPRRGILVGTDGSARSLPTIEQAFREASLHQQPLTVVHCLWDPLISRMGWAKLGAYDPGYDEAPALVTEVLVSMREKFPDVEVDVSLTKGDIEKCLADLSRVHELTVVGRHSHSLADRFGSLSLTTSIVEHAAGPVLVVP